MTSLAGDAMTRDEPLLKMAIPLDLNPLLNIWDNVYIYIYIYISLF